MDELLINNHLTRLENISRTAARCELDFRKLEPVSSDVDTIASFLGISHGQAILFSVIADLSLQRTVTLEIMSKHLNCSVLRLVSSLKETEALEKKGFIKKSLRKKDP